MPDAIVKKDSRDLNQQRDAVLEMLTERAELPPEKLNRLRNACIYFGQSMGAYNGWGDEHLIKAARSLVGKINLAHADADEKLISAEIAESLRNYIYNHLIAAEYSGDDEDPTKEWQDW